ncbi:AraC family transcriptional regulator [Aquimarina sp. M1]
MGKYKNSDWYIETSKALVKKYGDVLPQWIYASNSHPYSTGWRMGGGETHIMILNEWLDQEALSFNGCIAYLKKYPSPARWYSWIIQFLWNVDSHEFEASDYIPYFKKFQRLGFDNAADFTKDFNRTDLDKKYMNPTMKFHSEKEINKEYIQRINLALQYIDTHLDGDLSLESVSNIALYSPFHFHRIFKAVIGETLNAYVKRRRIEKIALELIHKKERSITELSLLHGFNSNSSFTRAFKNFYGVSPTEFRKQLPSTFSKISKVESKIGQEYQIFEKYICNITNHLNWITMNAKIEVKETPELYFASITHIGVIGIENTFEKLIKWGRSNGVFDEADTTMARVFHDSFKVTSPDKVRMSICMRTKKPVTVEGEITPIVIKKGRSIIGSFEITPDDFENAWSGLFVWMNEKGYKKSEETPFEIYYNDFRKHPENKCLVDLYIPIK